MSAPVVTASPAATAFTRDLVTIRCSGCTKIICKITREAVRAGGLVEIKCAACNQQNYLLGRLDP